MGKLLSLFIFSVLVTSQATSAAYTQGGCAWRTAALGFVKVYEICMFSGKGQPTQWEAAFTQPTQYAFELVLNFHHDVGGEKAAAAFQSSLDKNPAQNDLDTATRKNFLTWVQKENLTEGSRLTMTFNRKETGFPAVVVHTQGKETHEFKVPNLETAKALAGIYLGEPPFQKQIKTALLKEVK